jgi:hypothetical protein
MEKPKKVYYYHYHDKVSGHSCSKPISEDKFHTVINKWYAEVVGNNKRILVDATEFLENLYNYCQVNNAFRDENLLKNVKNIKLEYVYFEKENTNFGFIHYQILRRVKKFHMSVMEDYNELANRSKFKNMFKNYDAFNLRQLKFELGYWGINKMMEYMKEQPNVFFLNPKLEKITIVDKWGRPSDNIIVPKEFNEYYDAEIKHLKIKRDSFGDDSCGVKVILRRKKC